MISYLDDHSRGIPRSRVHHNSTAENTIKLLDGSINQYGKPEQVLTDREHDSARHEEADPQR
jgi:hypothetical protein